MAKVVVVLEKAIREILQQRGLNVGSLAPALILTIIPLATIVALGPASGDAKRCSTGTSRGRFGNAAARKRVLPAQNCLQYAQRRGRPSAVVLRVVQPQTLTVAAAPRSIVVLGDAIVPHPDGSGESDTPAGFPTATTPVDILEI
jgi:hypothetical protein